MRLWKRADKSEDWCGRNIIAIKLFQNAISRKEKERNMEKKRSEES